MNETPNSKSIGNDSSQGCMQCDQSVLDLFALLITPAPRLLLAAAMEANHDPRGAQYETGPAPS